MQYSSDEISIEEDPIPPMNEVTKNNSLKYLPRWPPVNIEFQDLSYSVPDLSGMYLQYSSIHFFNKPCAYSQIFKFNNSQYNDKKINKTIYVCLQGKS